MKRPAPSFERLIMSDGKMDNIPEAIEKVTKALNEVAPYSSIATLMAFRVHRHKHRLIIGDFIIKNTLAFEMKHLNKLEGEPLKGHVRTELINRLKETILLLNKNLEAIENN